MYLRYICIIAWIKILFLLLPSKISLHWCIKVCLFNNRTSVLISVLLINKKLISIQKHTFVWVYIFISLSQIPRRWIIGSYVKGKFYFTRSCQTLFQSSCIILRLYQQNVSSSCPTSSPSLDMVSNFFHCSNLKKYIPVSCVTIGYISLMISFLEYLFLCLHPSKYLLWCSVCSDLLLFNIGFSFIVWLLEKFMHSSYELCQKSDFKIVSLALWLISSFSEFFHRTQVFNFDEV